MAPGLFQLFLLPIHKLPFCPVAGEAASFFVLCTFLETEQIGWISSFLPPLHRFILDWRQQPLVIFLSQKYAFLKEGFLFLNLLFGLGEDESGGSVGWEGYGNLEWAMPVLVCWGVGEWGG